MTPASERAEEAISAELDVFTNEARIHPDQLHGKRVRDKLLLNLDLVCDDLHDPPFQQTVRIIINWMRERFEMLFQNLDVDSGKIMTVMNWTNQNVRCPRKKRT